MTLTEIEVWKSIPNYHRYEVSNMGNFRSLDGYVSRLDGTKHFWKGKTLKLSIDSLGYRQVALAKDGKRILFSAHRLVAFAFIPNPENKPQVNHKAGNKSDNRASELEWATKEENIEHAVRTGLMKQGADLPYSKVVLDLQTGIFYESIWEAALLRGIKYRTLNHWLSGDRKNKSSFILA